MTPVFPVVGGAGWLLNMKAPAFWKICRFTKSVVADLRFCWAPNLHFMYPYRFAPLRVSAIRTSNWGGEYKYLATVRYIA